MGPEVARDEVVQAEPRWAAAGWGLHTWVEVRGLWVCQQLLCTSSSPASRWQVAGLRTPGRTGASQLDSSLVRPRRALGEGGRERSGLCCPPS